MPELGAERVVAWLASGMWWWSLISLECDILFQHPNVLKGKARECLFKQFDALLKLVNVRLHQRCLGLPGGFQSKRLVQVACEDNIAFGGVLPGR